VRVVAAAATDGRDRADLRREQLASNRVKARQNRLINSAGPSKRDQVWPWFMSADWSRTWRLLWTSSLKEGSSVTY